MDQTLQNKIITGEIDINNKDLFMSILFKALCHQLNTQLYLRNKPIPHFMLNTGDDIMYLEVKGQDQSKEPKQQINEDFIYNSVPRCILNMNDIEVLEDQVTSPYSRGRFELEHKDQIVGFTGEFRRVPLKLTVSLKYYLDAFTDVLTVTQYIITKLLFIRTFKFDYLGETIEASYKVPTSYSNDKNITFDGGTTEQKLRTIELNLEVETNMPVFDERTTIKADNYITKINHNIITDGGIENINNIIDNKSKDKYVEFLESKIKEYKMKDIELSILLSTILNKINKADLNEESL